MTPPKKYLALGLEMGRLYRDPSGRIGRRLRFEEWRPRYCQLHGEKMGWEAVFTTIKESGQAGHLVVLDPLSHPVENAT